VLDNLSIIFEAVLSQKCRISFLKSHTVAVEPPSPKIFAQPSLNPIFNSQLSLILNLYFSFLLFSDPFCLIFYLSEGLCHIPIYQRVNFAPDTILQQHGQKVVSGVIFMID